MRVRPVLTIAALGAVAVALALRARQSDASCSGGGQCRARKVRVLGCEVIDAAQQPTVQRYLKALDPDRRRDRQDRYLRSYSGVFLHTAVLSARRVKCQLDDANPAEKHLPAGPQLGAFAFGPYDSEKEQDYFMGGVETSCAAYPAGRIVELRELASCCDGDPGVPCLYRGLGGSLALAKRDAGAR